MIELKDRPVTVLIHPKLELELKLRKQKAEIETNRPVKGGLTTYSLIAAFELESIRKSGEQIMKEILKLEKIPKYYFEIDGIEKEFVDVDVFKKLFMLVSILNKKKDQKQINVELSKIRGLKKNEAHIFW
jgi:hypothetical protein